MGSWPSVARAAEVALLSRISVLGSCSGCGEGCGWSLAAGLLSVVTFCRTGGCGADGCDVAVGDCDAVLLAVDEAGPGDVGDGVCAGLAVCAPGAVACGETPAADRAAAELEDSAAERIRKSSKKVGQRCIRSYHTPRPKLVGCGPRRRRWQRAQPETGIGHPKGSRATARSFLRVVFGSSPAAS